MNPSCPTHETDIKNLQCSHFWERECWATRFNEDNCVALCRGCHYFKFEKAKNGLYRDLMIYWLGQERYDALRKRHDDNVYKGVTAKHSDMIIQLMIKYGQETKKV